MDTSVIVGVIGCAVAAGTFFIGRKSSANTTGREWGELMSDIRNIKDDVKELKDGMSDQTKDLKASIRRLHNRIDEHLRNEHHIAIQKQSGEDEK